MAPSGFARHEWSFLLFHITVSAFRHSPASLRDAVVPEQTSQSGKGSQAGWFPQVLGRMEAAAAACQGMCIVQSVFNFLSRAPFCHN